MRVLACLCCLILSLISTGCLTTSSSGGFGRPASGSGKHQAPPDFLRTEHYALAKWLDARFDVSYRNLRLGGTARENIFSQQPIEEIHYRFEDVGRSGSLFHLEAKNISRREILYQVAQHYNLKMTIESIDGQPANVLVTGRSKGSRYDPANSSVGSGAVREF